MTLTNSSSLFPSRSRTVDSKLEEGNLGHQILKKMGELAGSEEGWDLRGGGGYAILFVLFLGP